MNPNLPCEFSNTPHWQNHIIFNCRQYERYITKDELFSKLKNLKLKSFKDKEVCPTGLIVAEEKNTRSQYRAPHKFQIFIKFNQKEKVYEEELFNALSKIITDVQGPFVEIPEDEFDTINDFDSVQEIQFKNIKKQDDTIKKITEQDYICRFRGDLDTSSFYKLFHIYKWAVENKDNREQWTNKMEFVEANKQKWGSDYIFTKLQAFKKQFDEDDIVLPPTTTQEEQKTETVLPPVNLNRVSSLPIKFTVKIEPKETEEIDLTDD